LYRHLIDNKRATDHADNLKTLKTTTPEGLKIRIKPHGVYVDKPQFKEEWSSTVDACQDLPKKCLIKHFKRSQKEAKNKFETDQKTSAIKLIALGVEKMMPWPE